MNTPTRIGGAILAVVVIVGTFIIANGSSDSDKPTKTVVVTQTSPTGGATVETTASAIPTIVIKNAKPVPGIKKLSFSNGDTIRFKVVSDTADEVHVHGYDLMKDVAPGHPVTFTFKGDIEGRFEAELEDHKQQILDFKVNP